MEKNKIKINPKLLFSMISIILLIVFCFAISPVTLQNDTYYTIKVGEHIVKNGIDMQDPFSWHQDLGYTYPHWGYDVITYFIYSAFGFTGIYFTTAILACILGILIYKVCSKISKNQVISFIVTIGAMYLLKGYIAARAQLVTFILFILTIYFIEQFLETKKKRYAVGLIIIPILIANLHIAVWPFYFVLYLPYIAEYLIAILGDTIIYKKITTTILKERIKILNKKQGKEEKIQKLEEKLKKIEERISRIKIKRTKELENPYKISINKNKNVKWLILIMIICIFTGLITPLGTEPYTYLYKTMIGNTTQNINEHLPMTLADQTDVMCTLIIFLAILIFTKAKIKLSDLFMIGGLCYLMLKSRRQLSMFAIIGAVILSKLLSQLVDMYIENGKEKITKIATSIGGIIIITVFLLALSFHLSKYKFDEKFVDKSTYPVDACNYILENIDLGTARFYNEYNYGSYMLFRNIPVFIDSRCDLYAPEYNGKEDIFMDFINTSNISTFYEDTFEKYDITHVITYKNSKMNMIITRTNDENYKELYEDDYFIIYERLNANL